MKFKSQLFRFLFPLFFFFALTLLLTYPLFLHINTSVITDAPYGDGGQNYWNLWWVHHSLFEHGKNPLWCDEIIYPIGTTLAFHTLNLINGLIFSPLMYFFSLTTIYNLVLFFSFWASGVTMYLLLRSLKVNCAPSLLGGVLFAYLPYRFAHISHQQLMTTQWIPLFLLFLLKAIRNKRRLDWILAALFYALVALSDWYYALYAAIFIAFIIIGYSLSLVKRLISSIIRKNNTAPKSDNTETTSASEGNKSFLDFSSWVFLEFLTRFLMFCLVTSVLLWFYMSPMLKEYRSGGDYMISDIPVMIYWSADLLAWLLPPQLYPLIELMGKGQLYGFTIGPEWMISPGLICTILFWVILLGRSFTGKKFFLGISLLYVILSLGPFLKVSHVIRLAEKLYMPLPVYTLINFPGFDVARCYARMSLFASLFLIIMICLGINTWYKIREERGLNPIRITYISWGLIGCVILEILLTGLINKTYPFPIHPIKFHPKLKELAQLENKTNWSVLQLPDTNLREGGYWMAAQTVHHQPMVNGYVSRAPLSVQEFRNNNYFLNQLSKGLDFKNTSQLDLTKLKISFQELVKRCNIRFIIIDKILRSDNDPIYPLLGTILDGSSMFKINHRDDEITLLERK